MSPPSDSLVRVADERSFDRHPFESVADPADGLSPVNEHQATLLCVDDEPGILDSYRHFLDTSTTQGWGTIRSARSSHKAAKPAVAVQFRVLLAESGAQAVEIAKEEAARGNRIQAAFFDMNMPGDMNGLETMRRVREIDPDILCVFATASQDYSLDEISGHFPPNCLDEWDYLNKPFTPNEIIQKARNLAASWVRRRHEESLLLQLDAANQTLETQVEERTHELAKANQELVRKGTELEELVRSKDQFLATVSHELRTPLTVVVGYAEELQLHRAGFAAADIDEFVTTIAEQSRDVSHIIDDLLVGARADIGTLSVHHETVDLRAEVDAVLRTGSLHREADRRLTVEGETALGWADPMRVRQILRNLVVNALRYGGEQIIVSVTEGDGRACVAVSDNGSGLPQAEAERIFEPYYRAHDTPSLPGSVGLGLAVSRRLARLMGGDVGYRRQQDWTVFELAVSSSPA